MTQDEARTCFEYRDGFMYWKQRGKGRQLGRPIGNQRTGYGRIRVNGRTYPTHSLIWLYHFGSLPELLDHVNLDKYDNRVENLRVATTQQNGANRPLNRNNTSGFRGVSFYGPRQKYRAMLGLNGSAVLLGYFNTAKEAKECYDKTAREWFGEYYPE